MGLDEVGESPPNPSEQREEGGKTTKIVSIKQDFSSKNLIENLP